MYQWHQQMGEVPGATKLIKYGNPTEELLILESRGLCKLLVTFHVKISLLLTFVSIDRYFISVSKNLFKNYTWNISSIIVVIRAQWW